MAGRKPDDAADELYGLAPADFTKARDALARRLRREGRRDAADAVKSLRKPTVPAWALNQLARRRPQDVKRLLAIGDRLRKAQDALLAGKDSSSLKRVSAEERALVDELARDAAAVAGEAGGAATASLDERIRATLHAAALDEHTARDLAAGRLVREREAVGMFGAPAEAVGPVAPARERRPRRDEERELATARAEHQRAQRAHTSAVKAAERARKRADDAQRRADEARERAAQASAALRDAERKERDAAKARDNAARAVAAAEKRIT